jgi:ABC-type nitrate/sulfonate/bicarbonate transport system substrate-binding protein
LNECNEVSSGSASAEDGQLAAGRIDGAYTCAPICEIAEAVGNSQVAWELASIKQFAIISYVLTFTMPNSKAHPKIVADMVDALNATQKWMVTHSSVVDAFAISQYASPEVTVPVERRASA